jgi:hypothetical protein
VAGEFTLPTELHAPILGLSDSIHLPFSPSIILELGNQSKDAHDEFTGAGSGVDRRIIQHLEAHALLGSEVERARRSIFVTNNVSPSLRNSRHCLSAGRPVSTPERFSLKTLSQHFSFSS